MKKNSVKINILIILLTGLFSLAPTCQSGITQSTTYPIELFSEMHYSPAYKSQETPRLKPVAEAVVNLDPIGTENQYDMTIEKFKYDYIRYNHYLVLRPNFVLKLILCFLCKDARIKTPNGTSLTRSS